MAKRVRRQHTAARAYLRGFADDRHQVCMHARAGQVERRNIGSATVVRDFYTYTDPAGSPDDSVERWLGERVEDAAAVVLRSLREGEDLRDGWVGALSAFVASSLVRTSTVRSYKEQIDGHLRPLLVVQEAARREGVDLPGLPDAARELLLDAARDALARVPDDPAERRRSHLRTMLRKADEWTAALSGWNWEALRAPAAVLVTGDAPVAVLPADPGRGWSGVLPAGSTVAVPIAPDLLLVASPRPLLGTGQAADALTGAVNAGIVSGCHRAVFHHPAMDWPPGLAVPSPPPRLPAPTIEWRHRSGGKPTFPVTYPPVADEAVRRMLGRLGAADTVD